jgi:hypothetical protein
MRIELAKIRAIRVNCLFLNTCNHQKRPQTGFFFAQIGKWPHGSIFQRTDSKIARTNRQNARTDRIFVARTGKRAHGTIFGRTDRKIARTD